MPAITARHIGIWALVLALLACAPNVGPQVKTISYRNPAAAIYSTATLPIARLEGTWRQVAGIGGQKPCTPAPYLQISATAAGGGPMAAYDLCWPQGRYRGSGAVRSAGAAGRYQLQGLDGPLWVIWISSDATAMAIGTPAGTFAMILSKTPISPDKLQSARQVLAWNGYDLAQIYKYSSWN